MTSSSDRLTPRALTVDGVVVAVAALLGLRLGLSPLSDNSAFTHLATGIRMVDDGLLPAIPRVDPYSFTAAGHEWVVQSWLPSAAVGWVYRLVGEHGVTVLSGLTMAALAAFTALLARTGRTATTVAAVAAALLVGVPLWAPRPLLVGLLCFAATIWVVDRRWAPVWLVPVVWVWVNSHGSFPLGLLWVGLVCVVADRRLWRYAASFGEGLLLAMLNPLGPKLLVFPLTALDKREVFSRVVEWGRPDFASVDGALVLVGLALALVLFVRQRPSWRELLPVAVFVVLGLAAERNLAALSIVLAAALGRSLQAPGAAQKAIRADLGRVLAPAFGVTALAVTVMAVQNPLVDASAYPVAAILWLEKENRFENPHRIATQDRVGNFLELRRGPRAEVFIDDRVDMFPVEVTKDYIAMVDGTDRGVSALQRWKIDTLLWRSGTPLVKRLVQSGDWKVAFRRAAYVVLIRRAD